MRKFGIELELGLRSGHTMREVSIALRDEGLGGMEHIYTGHSETQWVVKTDASVRNGVEVVSPPLDFDNPDDREQVNRALAAVKHLCKPVPSAGIHVHVESRGMPADQVAAVGRCFHHFEDVLYRIASSGWRSVRPGALQGAGFGGYAPPLTERQAQALTKVKNDADLRDAYYGAGNGWATSSHSHGARYCGLNLHSHFYRGTIEFRLFNSSLNKRRVQTYIAICMAMVNDARNGHKRSVNKRWKLGDMHDDESKARQAFHHFQQVLMGDHRKGGQPGGMSKADYWNLNKLWRDSRPQPPIGRR